MANTTPITQMFDAQRALIKQSNDAFRQSLAFQRETTKVFQNTFDSQESAQRHSVKATQQAINAYFEAIEDIDVDTDDADEGVSEVHDAVDEQFNAFLEFYEQSWDTFEDLAPGKC